MNICPSLCPLALDNLSALLPPKLLLLPSSPHVWERSTAKEKHNWKGSGAIHIQDRLNCLLWAFLAVKPVAGTPHFLRKLWKKEQLPLRETLRAGCAPDKQHRVTRNRAFILPVGTDSLSQVWKCPHLMKGWVEVLGGRCNRLRQLIITSRWCGSSWRQEASRCKEKLFCKESSTSNVLLLSKVAGLGREGCLFEWSWDLVGIWGVHHWLALHCAIVPYKVSPICLGYQSR